MADPAYKQHHREISRKGGLKGGSKGASEYQQQRLAWCPDEYRALYRHLIYSKRYLAIDAMRFVIGQMEVDEARRQTEERKQLEAERNRIMGRAA